MVKPVIKKVDSLQKVVKPKSVPEKPDYMKYLNMYVFDVILPSGIKLKLKPINAGQLKRFMSSIKNETIKEISDAMYEMISSSIVSENFDIGEIYLNDRPALILELRKASKGNEFQFEYDCPKCKSQSLITENLNDIKVIKKPVKINPIVELDENLHVQMDYVKVKEEKEILDLGMETETELLLSVIAVSIKSIMTPEGDQDDLTLEEKIFFTDNIPQQLYEKLTAWHDKFHFGVVMKKRIKCIHCNKKSDFSLDADNFFF